MIVQIVPLEIATRFYRYQLQFTGAIALQLGLLSNFSKFSILGFIFLAVRTTRKRRTCTTSKVLWYFSSNPFTTSASSNSIPALRTTGNNFEEMSNPMSFKLVLPASKSSSAAASSQILDRNIRVGGSYREVG